MLALNPDRVRFAGVLWDSVTRAAIDRGAARQVVEWSDAGPHVVLADVPEQRVLITIERQLTRDGIDAPRPGESGELTFYAAPAGSGAGRVRVRATCVVLSVTHELSGRKGAVRRVELIAVSGDGATDPVSVTAVEAES
jgi:hypothetical protein